MGEKKKFWSCTVFFSKNIEALTAERSETVRAEWLRTTHWAHLINYLRTDGYQMRLSIKPFQLDRVRFWSRSAKTIRELKGNAALSRNQKMGICFLWGIFRQRLNFTRQVQTFKFVWKIFGKIETSFFFHYLGLPLHRGFVDLVPLSRWSSWEIFHQIFTAGSGTLHNFFTTRLMHASCQDTF